MVDRGGPTFSVIYFDGEKEISIGKVTIDPFFTFTKFISFLSNKIGISSHQFSVYLATGGSNWKIPITAKVNFAAIVRDNARVTASSYFFVKRSKQPKKNNVHSKKGSWINNNNNNIINNYSKANVVQIRRNTAVESPVQSHFLYERNMMDLLMQRERYLMSIASGRVHGGNVTCKECLAEKNGGFHPCLFDEITFCFKSRVGPVARPSKRTG